VTKFVFECLNQCGRESFYTCLLVCVPVCQAAPTIFVLKHSTTKTNFGTNYNMVVAPKRAPPCTTRHLSCNRVPWYAILA